MAGGYHRRRWGWNAGALRLLVRHAGRPELAASLRASRQQAPPPETISAAQYERLLGEPDLTTPVGVRDRAILRLLGDVGLRPSEVCALHLGDIIWGDDGQVPVQLEVAWARVGLSSSPPRRPPPWPAGCHIIRTGRLTGGAGSCRRRRHWAPLLVVLGLPMPARQAQIEAGLLRQVLRHAQAAGIPAQLRYPSVLRHFWAAQQVAGGITPAQLQARGGWRDRRSAQVYFQ